MNELRLCHIERIPKWENIDVNELVSAVCRQKLAQLAEKNVSTDVNVDQGTTVVADRTLFCVAVERLIEQALAATPAGGAICITAWKGRDVLELEVADDGAGIEQDWRRQELDPSGGSVSHDSNKALDEVRRIADVHGGCLFATNCPQGGAAFTIRIPTIAKKRAA